MVWQHLSVEDDNSFNGNSGTDTIKIPRSYAIGDLALTVRAQNGGTNNSVKKMAAFHSNVISKQGELLGHLNRDNQQRSAFGNKCERPTTNPRYLDEVCNGNTSALHPIFG